MVATQTIDKADTKNTTVTPVVTKTPLIKKPVVQKATEFVLYCPFDQRKADIKREIAHSWKDNKAVGWRIKCPKCKRIIDVRIRKDINYGI